MNTDINTGLQEILAMLQKVQDLARGGPSDKVQAPTRPLDAYHLIREQKGLSTLGGLCEYVMILEAELDGQEQGAPEDYFRILRENDLGSLSGLCEYVRSLEAEVDVQEQIDDLRAQNIELKELLDIAQACPPPSPGWSGMLEPEA